MELEIDQRCSETFRPLFAFPDKFDVTYQYTSMKMWFLRKYSPREHFWRTGTDHTRILAMITVLVQNNVIPIVFCHVLSYIETIYDRVIIDYDHENKITIDANNKKSAMFLFNFEYAKYGFKRIGPWCCRLVIGKK